MSVQFNIGGVIKTPSKVQANIGGVIKEISKIQANIGGVIKDIWTAAGGGFDSYVKSLLHFNGLDASTTFTDETGKTWTRQGDAQLDTAQKKFGTASGLFDGTGDYIDTPDSADFDVGSGDFTVDFWVRRNGSGEMYLAGQCDSGINATNSSFCIYFDSANKPRATVMCSSYQYVTPAGSTAVTDSAWNHIAVVVHENTLTLYMGGVAQGSVYVAGITINNSNCKLAIGRPGENNGGYFNGWIDEFRFSKGIARHTSNFTPPTSEYTA